MAAVGGEGAEGAARRRRRRVAAAAGAAGRRGRRLEGVDVDDALDLLDEIPVAVPPSHSGHTSLNTFSIVSFFLNVLGNLLFSISPIFIMFLAHVKLVNKFSTLDWNLNHF